MDVDEISNDDLEALTRRVNTDRGAHLRQIFAALDAESVAGAHRSTEEPVRRMAGRPPARQSCQLVRDWAERELAHCRIKAEKGDSASARRVAELLELIDQPSEAVAWWHRAAEAGDPDAVLYVEEFYNR